MCKNLWAKQNRLKNLEFYKQKDHNRYWNDRENQIGRMRNYQKTEVGKKDKAKGDKKYYTAHREEIKKYQKNYHRERYKIPEIKQKITFNNNNYRKTEKGREISKSMAKKYRIKHPGYAASSSKKEKIRKNKKNSKMANKV